MVVQKAVHRLPLKAVTWVLLSDGRYAALSGPWRRPRRNFGPERPPIPQPDGRQILLKDRGEGEAAVRCSEAPDILLSSRSADVAAAWTAGPWLP